MSEPRITRHALWEDVLDLARLSLPPASDS